MKRTASVLAAVLLAPVATGAQADRFTPDDMLNVVTASVQDVSEDGRFVALAERRTRDNAETDNYRYGDPTFIAPSAIRLVIVDLETGQRTLPMGDRLLNLRQAAFSRDGRRLALLVASREQHRRETATARSAVS